MTEHSPDQPDDERVPLFGTWRAAYTAVVLWALVVMGAIALFSTRPF